MWMWIWGKSHQHRITTYSSSKQENLYPGAKVTIGAVLENVSSSLVISKIHNMIFKGIYSPSHDLTAHNSTQSLSCIRCGHSLITQEFPVIVNPYLLVQLTYIMSKLPHAICHSTNNGMFPTHTPLIWFTIEAAQIEFPCDLMLFQKTLETLVLS